MATKYLKKILFVLILFPYFAYASFAVPWVATSTTQAWIFPSKVNGVEQNVVGSTFIATSTTATSTFSNGLILLRGCFFINGACFTGSGTVTSVTGIFPIASSGGNTPSITFNGLGTSSAAVISNIPYFSGVNTFANVATTAIACSGNISCTAFNALGSASTISFTGTLPIANGGTNATTFSVFSPIVFDGTRLVATTTNPFYVTRITATGTIASILPYASTTAITVSTISSTTDQIISSTGGLTQCLHVTGVGLVSGTGVECGSSVLADWNKQSTYNILSLTPTTTIPIWAKSQLFASSSAIFDGKVTADTFTATNTAATSTFNGFFTAKRLDSTGNATNTATQGWNVTGGCFAINGTCISGSGGSTNPGGTGTEIQYRSGASTFGAITNSAVAVGGVYTGIGTTTPQWLVQLASSTAPQLTLTDSAGYPHVSLRNSQGNFSISTSSDITYATTSVPELQINTNSAAGLSIGATNTPAAMLSITPQAGGFANQMLVGSTSKTSFQIDNSGHIFAPITTSSGANQTGYWCYDGSGQLIRDTTVCLVSALKFKKDITPIDVGLNEVLKMRPVNFFLKENLGENDKVQQFGFIADEVEKIDSRLVTYDSKGEVHGFRYEQFTAILAKAIQDLNLKVNVQYIFTVILTCFVIYQQIQIKKIKK